MATPRVARSSADLELSRFVRGKNLFELCDEYRADHPADDFFVVSNKVSDLDDTMTHASARGSNEMIGRNILSTMTWMTPDEYEMRQAWNAWAGRRDFVGLRHVDELNQTLGRNLGFRHRDGARHVVLANLRLFQTLFEHPESALGRLRYGLTLRTTSEERRAK